MTKIGAKVGVSYKKKPGTGVIPPTDGGYLPFLADNIKVRMNIVYGNFPVESIGEGAGHIYTLKL